MRKNEEYIATCIDDTDLNSGVVKIDDMVVFVPNLMIGEKAKIKIVKVNKTYAFGIIIDLIEKSQYRIKPMCPIFKQCGGCQLQYMSYDKQLDYRYRHIKKLFPNVEVRKVLGMDDPTYYRNKAQFPIQIKDGKVLMGFYRQHSNDVVDCDECMIQSKAINEIYRYIKSCLNIDNAKGLRHLFIRHSSLDEIQIVFIGKNEKKIMTLIKPLIDRFEIIKSIIFNYNDRNDNVIIGDKYKVLYGTDHIYEMCFDNKIKLNFKAFYQVNPIMMQVLYQQALDAAKLSLDDICIDMYAGTGTIGMAAARHVREVIGVEIIKEAVDNANENVRINHLDNCHYVCQDATIFAKEYQGRADVIFIDPPRKGMSEQGINDTVSFGADRIVYVSCNPKTLARDIKLFEQHDYQCEYVQPVDMFAQTLGLECVCLLQRKQKNLITRCFSINK